MPKRIIVVEYSPEQRRRNALARARIEREARQKAEEDARKKARAKATAQRQLEIQRASAAAKRPRPGNVGLLASQSQKSASFGREGDMPNRLTPDAQYIRDNGLTG
jgi:hypothetical protein